MTGANIGLGLESARHFARLGASKVILACRNVEKGESAKQDIAASTATNGVAEVWPLDLGSFESVKEFCRRADKLGRLDVLVANAGIATGEHQFLEGYESTITTNVISTFLMALLLLPKLRKSASQYNTTPHLVIVASDAHVLVRQALVHNCPGVATDISKATFEERSQADIMAVYRTKQMSEDRYNVSKLLDVLLTRELATQMVGSGKNLVILNTLSPGMCKSALFRHAPFPLNAVINTCLFLVGRSSEVGSRTILAAACGDWETHGSYMDSCEVQDPSSFVLSAEGAQVQRQVFSELLIILEGIEPGVSKNI